MDDSRESPAFRLLELFAGSGAALRDHDPHVARLPKSRHYKLPNLASEPLTAEFLASRDAVMIVTDHTNVDYDFVVEHAPLVIDTRNATRDLQGRRNVFAA